ncbi:MAG: DUF993 family protein, partial [Burkholderiales bacterium]|nr:DUF993 family protein [Burkholderiales bacterium]
MPTLLLPTPDGHTESYRLVGTPWVGVRPARPFNRVVFSAAHVVADPLAEGDPAAGGAIDW